MTAPWICTDEPYDIDDGGGVDGDFGDSDYGHSDAAAASNIVTQPPGPFSRSKGREADKLPGVSFLA